MLARPNPTRLEPLVEDIDLARLRRRLCGWYEHCEEQAEVGGWTSWTCARCPLFPLGMSVPRALA